MYNLKEISDYFIAQKIVAFKNPLTNDVAPFDSQLRGSSLSGLYFNAGIHSYLNSWNTLQSLMPLVTDWAITDWSSIVTYGVYADSGLFTDIVKSGTKYYESIYSPVATPNLNKIVTNTTYWREVTMESLWLRQTICDAIEQVLARVINLDPIVNSQEFVRLGNTATEQMTLAAGKYGIRFYPIGSRHVAIRINQILLQTLGGATVPMYLVRGNTTLQTIQVVSSNNGVWFTPTAPLAVSLNQGEGAWFLYFDTTGLATEKIVADPSFYIYDSFYRHAHINPFFAAMSLTDLNQVATDGITYSSNYGINLNLTIEYDPTNWVKVHLKNMAETIQLQWGYNMLRLLLDNPEGRSNRLQRIVNKETIDFETSSFEGYTVIKRLSASYKKLETSVRRLGLYDECFAESEDPLFDTGSV